MLIVTVNVLMPFGKEPWLTTRGEGMRGREPRAVTVGPDQHLTYLMARAAHRLEVTLDRALQQHGVTLRQFSALAHIARQPGVSGADLARMLLISPQAVTTLVQRMTAAGLVDHGQTGRGVAGALRLTEHGLERLTVAEATATRVETQALSLIPLADQRHIVRSLRRLLAWPSDANSNE